MAQVLIDSLCPANRLRDVLRFRIQKSRQEVATFAAELSNLLEQQALLESVPDLIQDSKQTVKELIRCRRERARVSFELENSIADAEECVLFEGDRSSSLPSNQVCSVYSS